VSRRLPYGSWPSPISPADLAEAGVRLGGPLFRDGELWWTELRPSEGGRVALVRRDRGGAVADVGPADLSVRTLVHEYGGGAWTLSAAGPVVSSFVDQRLWLLPESADPVPLTPEPPRPRSVRFADAEVDEGRGALYAVRETHPEVGEVVNDLVRVPLGGGEPQRVAGGHDFFASPRLSPDGGTLVWLTWDHPRMPWDGTELWAAAVTADGSLGSPRLVAGGPEEAVLQPRFDRDGALLFLSDRSGWWNLYRAGAGGAAQPLAPDDAEYGVPAWVFAMGTYVLLDDGRIAAIRWRDGLAELVVLSASGPAPVPLPFVSLSDPVALDDGRVALVAAATDAPPRLVAVTVDSGAVETLRAPAGVDLDPGDVSAAEPISFPTTGGAVAHGLFYAPHRAGIEGSAGEAPPLLVLSHGGPTASADPGFALSVQFWTTRGIAVVDVDYRGSTGYGRDYRQALDGQWGVADVEDCIAAARFLVDRGDADGERLLVKGGSAGGYTTLAALTFHDVFAAGASRYGIGDLETLVRDTHKFEARYCDRLVAPWPEGADVYRARSPIHHTERLRTPMIILQGSEDAIVPPNQAEEMVAALDAAGLPYAYLLFEGEQHGFRQAANIARAVEAEYVFFCRVLGIEPSGDPAALEIHHLDGAGR
jgi:dipeptidyl aminopeptidase/acylaminoacyl peptidase